VRKEIHRLGLETFVKIISVTFTSGVLMLPMTDKKFKPCMCRSYSKVMKHVSELIEESLGAPEYSSICIIS
jgi:hypothetical protein